MESIWHAIILGLIQGLTEFLPVSSSGHLELAKFILDNENIFEGDLLFTVTLHAATALSTLIVFWKEVAQIIKGLFQFKWNQEFRFSINIIISMMPAVFVGLFFDDVIDALFTKQIVLVGSMLLVTGILLFLADKAKKTKKNILFNHAFIIGLAQAIAILPGISRSGATISTSVLLGIDREKAARFSFLMVIPLIFGKMGNDILGGQISSNASILIPLIIGFITAFLTGIIACKWMISIVKKSQLKYFSYYCFILGIAAIYYSCI